MSIAHNPKVSSDLNHKELRDRQTDKLSMQSRALASIVDGASLFSSKSCTNNVQSIYCSWALRTMSRDTIVCGDLILLQRSDGQALEGVGSLLL